MNSDILAEKSIQHSSVLPYNTQKRNYITCQKRKRKNPCCESDNREASKRFTLISTPRLFENYVGIQTDFWNPRPGLVFLLKDSLPDYFVALLNRVGLGCSLSQGQFDQKVCTWRKVLDFILSWYVGMFSLDPWKLCVQVTFHVTQVREYT